MRKVTTAARKQGRNSATTHTDGTGKSTGLQGNGRCGGARASELTPSPDTQTLVNECVRDLSTATQRNTSRNAPRLYQD